MEAWCDVRMVNIDAVKRLYYYTSYPTPIISIIIILKRCCKTISYLRNLHKFISQQDAINERRTPRFPLMLCGE